MKMLVSWRQIIPLYCASCPRSTTKPLALCGCEHARMHARRDRESSGASAFRCERRQTQVQHLTDGPTGAARDARRVVLQRRRGTQKVLIMNRRSKSCNTAACDVTPSTRTHRNRGKSVVVGRQDEHGGCAAVGLRGASQPGLQLHQHKHTGKLLRYMQRHANRQLPVKQRNIQ